MNNKIVDNSDDINVIYGNIESLIKNSKNRIYTAVNTEILTLYWSIGKIIVDIQDGEKRAKYGKNILKELSKNLTKEYGNGYSIINLRRMRQFYLMFPIRSSLMNELTWTHYLDLMKIKEEKKREFYMYECINSRWSVRELQRQIKSKMHDRLIKSENNTSRLTNNELSVTNGQDLLKDPYVLEFLKLNMNYSEKELENNILEHLKEFLLELGRGYSLVGRQLRITIDNNHYYPDLIFYNNIAKSYLIIDLKIGKFSHKDIGQMLMYVNYYDKEIKTTDENKTIGLLLCKEKNNIVVKYTLPKNINNIYVSKYLLHLPSEDELTKVISEKINH